MKKHFYYFSFVDKSNNELKTEKHECVNIKEARGLAAKKMAANMINDLKKIKVSKIF